MRGQLSRKRISDMRRIYKAGSTVMLDSMDDLHAPPVGTLGTVVGVDDIGSIMVNWNNGSTLSVVYGIDHCHLVRHEEEKNAIK